MAPTKQTKAAKTNVKKAQKAVSSRKPTTSGAAKAKTTLGNKGAAVARRAGGAAEKTRAELYELAKKRDLPGRSKMSRDELARKLGLGGRTAKSAAAKPAAAKPTAAKRATTNRITGKRAKPQTGNIATDTLAPH